MVTSSDAILEAAARIAALFGTPARVRIIQLLAQAPRSVEDVAHITGESVANASQHLRKLLEGGLLVVEKKKSSRIYALADERLALMLEDLLDVVERLSPRRVEASSSGDESFWSPVGSDAVFEGVGQRKAVLLDVRESYESTTTPIEGAVRVPLAELPAFLPELARTKTYYLICSGRACPKATAGVELLRRKGFKAFRLKESPASLRLNRQGRWDETMSVEKSGRAGRR
jgi:DNA-binding transcriptional ArsR family regulator/rhodanese-related sulfurtransferase